MSRARTSAPLLALVFVGVAACHSATEPASEPNGSRLALTIAPLDLPGVTNAQYSIAVHNALAEEVFSAVVDADQYGDGAGSVAYVGPCDAGANDNSVTVTLARLFDQGGLIPASSYANPGPLTRSFECRENQDVSVTFDLAILRRAEQGFFDIAVTFDDIFCSAKLDCRTDSDGDGDVDLQDATIKLLHDDADGERASTVVLGFACTAGPGTDTQLLMDDLLVDCFDSAGDAAGSYLFDVSSGPGNAGGDGPFMFQRAIYRGKEQLGYGKCFWNAAIGIDESQLPYRCVLRGRATAVDGVQTPWQTPGGVVYPVIDWNVTLNDSAQGSGLTCTRYAADATAGEVATHYTDFSGASFTHGLSCADQTVGTAGSDTCTGTFGGVSGAFAVTATEAGVYATIGGTTSPLYPLPPGVTLDTGCCVDPCCEAAVCGNGVVESGETCDGACPTACDDGDVCTDEVLIGSAVDCTAECSVTVNVNACDDNSVCTVGDVCTGAEGRCSGTDNSATECNDNNACTMDYCNAVSGCGHNLIAGCCVADLECDDGDPCTFDVCDTGLDTCTNAAAPVCNTVCPADHPSGPCDYTSIAACAIKDGNGDGTPDGIAQLDPNNVCRVFGGVYNETVTYHTSLRQIGLMIRCEPGETCVLDGDGSIKQAVVGWQDWGLEGFEVRNYTSDALSKVPFIRDSYIHDVGGAAITNLVATAQAVVERNIIAGAMRLGISAPGGAQLVRNNLIVNVSGITGLGDLLLEHNTIVDVHGSTTGPTVVVAGAAYNIFHDPHEQFFSVSSPGTSDTNILSNNADPYSATFGGTISGDRVVDAGFLGPETYRPAATSPAIGGATGSTALYDLDRRNRNAVPEIGAYEFDFTRAAAPRWPVRENIDGAPIPTTINRPSMALLPDGPAIAVGDSSTLYFAARRDDGTWPVEVVASRALVDGNIDGDAPQALLASPASGNAWLAYAHRSTGAGTVELRFAERFGDGCGFGCSSSQWWGCSADLIDTYAYASVPLVTLRIAADPSTQEPVVAALFEDPTGCQGAPGSVISGASFIEVYRRVAGVWVKRRAADHPCTEVVRIGPHFALAFDEAGNPAVLWPRTTNLNGSSATFDLFLSTDLASDEPVGYLGVNVPLGGLRHTLGFNNPLALALAPDGTLGVAFHAPNGPTLIERAAGSWGTPTLAGAGDSQPTSLTVNPSRVRAMGLVYRSTSEPVIGYVIDASSAGGFPIVAEREGAEWNYRFINADRDLVRAETQPFDVAVLSGDKIALTYTLEATSNFDRVVHFQAEADPGGVPATASDPTACICSPSCAPSARCSASADCASGTCTDGVCD